MIGVVQSEFEREGSIVGQKPARRAQIQRNAEQIRRSTHLHHLLEVFVRYRNVDLLKSFAVTHRNGEIQNGDLAGHDFFLEWAAETGNDVGREDSKLRNLPEHQIGSVCGESEERRRQPNPER